MSVRNSHARPQKRDTCFTTCFGDVTLHAEAFVVKGRLYSLKRKILAGKTGLDLKTFRHFRLFEDGRVEPITENWALR